MDLRSSRSGARVAGMVLVLRPILDAAAVAAVDVVVVPVVLVVLFETAAPNQSHTLPFGRGTIVQNLPNRVPYFRDCVDATLPRFHDMMECGAMDLPSM